jgi:hypothetical protein
MICIHHSKLQIRPIYGLPVTFMAFKHKLLAFHIKLTPNDPNQGQNNLKNKFLSYGLCFDLQKISAFFMFFEILDA